MVELIETVMVKGCIIFNKSGVRGTFTKFVIMLKFVAIVHLASIFGNPLEVIEAGLKSVIDVNAKYVKMGKSMSPEHVSELSSLAESYINFAEMARRSFGSLWNDLNEEQREEAVTLMKNVLINSYIDKVARVQPGQVRVISEVVSGDRADVLSRVDDKQGPIQIDYRLRKNGDRWMVVDVVVEKVSLVANYRQEFAAINRSEGVQGVLNALRKKLESRKPEEPNK